MARHISANRLYQLPPDVNVVSSVERPGLDRIDLTVEFPPQERVCPKCGSSHCWIKESGKIRTVRHLPAANRSVFISYKRRRYFCNDCHSTYYESVDWIHDQLQMTNALLADICLQLTNLVSIRDIAERELVTPAVVGDVFSLISIDRPSELPHVLCVDEFKGNAGEWNPETKRWNTRKFLCNLTDGDAGVLIDVLPEIKGDYLIRYFKEGYSLEQRRRVQFFCCDMHSGFMYIAKECFPNAVICIDLSTTRSRCLSGSPLGFTALRTSENVCSLYAVLFSLPAPLPRRSQTRSLARRAKRTISLPRATVAAYYP